jgi:hypothetical protein
MNAEEMKTTDGKELSKNHYYHTRYGEQCLLHDWAIGRNGPIFVISKFYEGEAMEAHCDGGSHSERTIPYEYECEIMPVGELFKDSPMFVVEEEYKKKAEETVALCASIGALERVIKASSKQGEALTHKLKELETRAVNLESTSAKLEETNKERKEALSELRGQISTAKDRLGDLVQTGNMATITQEELGQLRKDQYRLECLNAAGVSKSWDGHDDAMNTFLERYPS